MIFYVIFESKNFTNWNNHFIHVLITEYIFVALPASQYDNILETNIPSIHGHAYANDHPCINLQKCGFSQ